MSNARKLADLLDSNGDVKSDSLDNVDGLPDAIDVNASAPADTLNIDSSGNVGIGVTPPTQYGDHTMLHVGAQSTLGGNKTLSTTSQIYLTHNLYPDTNGTWQVFNTSGANQGTLLQMNDGMLRFRNSPATTGTPALTERLRIDESGRVTKPYTPCCVVTKSNVGSYTSNDQVVSINNTHLNVGSHFSYSGYKFTAPISGYYLLTFSAHSESDSNATSLRFRKNGVNIPAGTGYTRGSSHGHLGATTIHYLSANDYIDLYKGSGTVWGGDTPSGVNWSCYLLG